MTVARTSTRNEQVCTGDKSGDFSRHRSIYSVGDGG
jgi:hypothetical protein